MIDKEQQRRKDELNKRFIRNKATNVIIRALRQSLIKKKQQQQEEIPKQPTISTKTPEQAAALILKNIKTFSFNKKLKQRINKKMQQKLLKEPISSLSSLSEGQKESKEDETRKMDILRKNFNQKRIEQDKEVLKNQKERKKDFPKSFKDKLTKDFYIEKLNDEYGIYKSDTFKLYDKLQAIKKKPINLKNQKKLYDLELEILLIGGEARFWKDEITRAKTLKIKD